VPCSENSRPAAEVCGFPHLAQRARQIWGTQDGAGVGSLQKERPRRTICFYQNSSTEFSAACLDQVLNGMSYAEDCGFVEMLA
jgi:hypothetical protein